MRKMMLRYILTDEARGEGRGGKIGSWGDCCSGGYHTVEVEGTCRLGDVPRIHVPCAFQLTPTHISLLPDCDMCRRTSFTMG